MVLFGGGGRGPTTTFDQKGTTFCFWFPFDEEAFKTCKNIIKLIDLCAPPLSRVIEYMTKSGTLTTTGEKVVEYPSPPLPKD